MAKAKWCGDAIYDAAATFKQRCLIEDNALFTLDADVWTPGRVRLVADRAGVGHAESGAFIDKLEKQLDGLDPAAIQVAAELLFILLLAEKDTSADKKREHLVRLVGLLPSSITLPREIDAALDGGGVANIAAGKAHRDAGLRFLTAVAARVKDLPASDRAALLASPWETHSLVSEVRSSAGAMYANAFLHLMFPDQFEYIVSEAHRARLLQTFQSAPDVADQADADRQIARIRELASVGGAYDIELYEEPLHRVWSEDAPPRWVEAVHWARRLYEWDAFDRNERDYKLEIAAKVAAARDRLIAGDPNWLERLRAAFGPPNNLTSWRAHDVFLKWCATNEREAGRLLGAVWTADDVPSALQDFLRELPRDAAGGTGTRLSLASFLLLGLDATRWPFFKPSVYGDFKKLLGLPGAQRVSIDPEVVYRPEELAARLGLDGRRVREFLRRAYPRADAERGAAWYLTPEQAQEVVDEFGGEIDQSAGHAAYADWLALLEELRLRMLAAGVQLRDLLDAQGLAYWLVKNGAPEEWDEADRAAFGAFQKGTATTARTQPDESSRPSRLGAVALPPITSDLARRLHLPVPWLERLVGLLTEKKQLILYGPPGTGKTFVAQHLGRHIAEHGGSYRLVQFHPSYTYEDFFEGYRPLHHGNGALSFELVPGVLREISRVAAERPSVPHLLIIDEINRGNIAKIFGELYFLLEYRNESIRLQYSRDEDFRLPENLFFVGTMNTADRSIALVDSALRRRFYFVGLIPTKEPVNRVLGEWLAARGLPPDAADLLAELNRTIDDDDFAIGPSYFMTDSADGPDLERIWAHAVMPLLEEHYYGTGRDVEKEFGLAAIRARVAAAADASLVSD